MPVNPDRIRDNRWRQGSVFSVEEGRNILGEPETSARLILVSHDCDIVHSGTREPVVEVCVALPLERMNGSYARAKNPRILHLTLQVAGNAVPHEIEASNRRQIDRSQLETMMPANNVVLPAEDLRIITRWLAKRYDRAALPDRFNERLVPAQEAIRLALQGGGARLSMIMLHLDPEDELPVDASYRVFLFALMPKEIFENEPDRIAGTATIAQVAAAMSRCNGIEIVDFALLSEDDLTLHDLHSLIEYTCEDLSLGENDGAPRLPRS